MDESDRKDTSEESVQFRYIKSEYFRVIHANGAWGGLTPQAEIHMVIFSERPAIPDAIVHAITDDGRLGKEIASKGEGGAVRECEVDVVLSYATSKALLAWLNGHVQQLESVIREAKEKREQTTEEQRT